MSIEAITYLITISSSSINSPYNLYSAYLLPTVYLGNMSNVKVTLRYHPITYHLFLAILYFTTVFNAYLLIVFIAYLLPITN